MPVLSVLANGLPTEKLKTDLACLLDLSKDEHDRLVSYLTDPKTPLPSGVTDIAKMAETVAIDASELNSQMNLIRYILTNWRKSGAQIGEVERELAALGYSGERLERARDFFERLSSLKEKLFVVDARGDAEISGLPTIDEMSLVWDIRPIFGAADWSPRNGRNESPVTEWLAHSNMLIIEIMCSNRESKKESLSVQLSEEEFEELERLVGIARKQLDVIHTKRFI